MTEYEKSKYAEYSKELERIRKKLADKDHQRLKRNLELIQNSYTVAELSVVLDISANTWTNRMKEPWKRFSYDDLRTIAHYCRIDFIKLVDGELRIG